jgi:hypothetical protein
MRGPICRRNNALRRRRSTCLALAAICLALATSAPAQDNAEAAPAKKSPLSRIQGRTYFDRNRDVTGATVLVRPQDDPSRLFLTASDGKGNFRVDDLPNGQYLVVVEREGLAPVVKTDVELRFPFRAVVELPMQRRGGADDAEAETAAAKASTPVGLTGTVVERDGGPVADVTLRFVRADGTADPRRVRTDGEGLFELTELPGGLWRVEVLGVGFLPLRTRLDLDADAELHVALVEQPVSYEPSPLDLMPPEQPLVPEVFR